MIRTKPNWFGQQRIPVRFISLGAITTLALTALLFSVYGLEPQDTLKVGELSPRSYQAPVDLQIVNELATERERRVARDQVQPIYTADTYLQRLITSSLSTLGLPEDVETLLLSAYERPSGVTEAQRAELIDEAVALTAPDRRQRIELLLEDNLLSTSVPNETLTTIARDAAANGVKPTLQTVRAGEVIVEAGELLTEDHLAVLRDAGLYSANADINNRLVQIFLSCLLWAFVFTLPLLYLARTQRQLSFAQLAFLVVFSLLILIAQRAMFIVNPTFLFVAILPILVSVLVTEVTGMLWAAWLAVFLTMLEPGAPTFMLLTVLTGGVAAALLARTFKARLSLAFGGALGGLIASLGYMLLLVIYGSSLTWGTVTNMLLLMGGGVLAGIIALGLLPVAESAFGFLTDFRLAELSNPSTPLLQRLLLEAPGTYQHSLIISNLVEQAVTNIGGNALLARVGSMYHDVGKMKRPHFFVENQVTGENPHSKISPHLSYLIITSHVRDGVDLLREYKLPKALEPFAATHHGTTVLSYFYKQALEQSDDINELNFRYPGPRPKTKETAVLMLADAVESASRTLAEPSQSSIRALIDRIIETRLQDGQLADSPLNLRDLEIIASTFERMMTAILHRRIAYPSNEEIRTLERGGTNRRNQTVPAS